MPNQKKFSKMMFADDIDINPNYYRIRPNLASNRILLMLDGGITRGTDVFKAIALGADLCFIGRPVLWALAVDGQKGVQKLLQMLNDELANVMTLAGCQNISQITPHKLQTTSKGKL